MGLQRPGAATRHACVAFLRAMVELSHAPGLLTNTDPLLLHHPQACLVSFRGDQLHCPSQREFGGTWQILVEFEPRKDDGYAGIGTMRSRASSAAKAMAAGTCSGFSDGY